MKLIIQDNLTMCKIFLTTFKGSIRAWYNNLKPGLVASFNGLCLRIIALTKSQEIICILPTGNLQGIDIVFLVLYAVVFKG
jgi:hypothetical protein